MKKSYLIITMMLLGLTISSYSQTARVQIIHNSADTAAKTVDIYANTTRIADDLNFREATAFLSVSSNVNVDITVQPSNSTDTTNGLYRTTINLDSNTNYVVVANGIVSATGYNPLTAFDLDIYSSAQDTSVGGASKVDVLVHHGSTDAPIVDVVETSVPAGTIVNNLDYGDFQGYLALDTANYIIEVRDSANSKIIAAYEAPLAALNAGGLALTVVASGFVDSTQNSNGRSFGLFAATPAGGDLIALPAADIPTARVQVIHNSADTAARFVDVWLNDAPLLNNFEFRTASPFVDLQAGVPFVVSIADSASTDTAGALAQYTYTLEKDSTYILVANGIVSMSGYSPATPFNIEVFGSAREVSSSAATTDVLVFHGSTDAPVVDVVETSVPAGTIVDNLDYAEFQGYLTLDTANYVIEVRDSANSQIIAAYQAPLAALNTGGLALTVVASGFVDSTQNSNGRSFGLFAVTPLGGDLIALPAADIPTARVQVIHNAADTAAKFVDVWLNDAPLLNNFEFRTASPFVDLQAGVPFVVSIADSASTDTVGALAQYTYTLEEDSTYVLVANGIVSTSGYSPLTAFNIEVFVGARETATSTTNTDILVFHGATDAPAVDVEETSTSSVLVDSIDYAEFQGYVSVATQDYTLELFDATTSASLGTFSAELSTLNLDGEAITVVASGFVDPTVNSSGAGFGLWAAVASGGPLVELDNVTSLSENQLLEDNAFTVYPNPSSDIIYIQNNNNVIIDRYEIVNINQQVVKSLSTANENTIQVGDLPSGLYFLKIFSGDEMGVKRLIVK